MFDLLDSSHDGTIGLPEFLLGTLRLKGGARRQLQSLSPVMPFFQCRSHVDLLILLIHEVFQSEVFLNLDPIEG